MSDAESLLRELIAKIAIEHNFGDHEVNIKAINSGGANYTSVLFLITLKFPDKEDVQLFAKVACMGEKLREMLDAKKLYNIEVFFYTKLSKVYQTLEAKENLNDEDRFVFPKFYGSNTNLNEETVVLQNLVADGYRNYNRFISIDWEHAASTIENLAKLHALSFAYQKDNPQEFEELCKDLVYVDKVEKNDEIKGLTEKCIKRVVDGVKEDYRLRIYKCLEKWGEDAIWIKFKRPLGTKVICHGDFRPSNLMYRQQDNKVEAIIVDYQTMHVGSPAADLLYFILCGSDSEFRAEYQDRLLDHYYTELCAAMQRLGVVATEVYPREVFDSEVKEMMPMFLTLGMFLLPLVLVEEDQAPNTNTEAGVETFAVSCNDLFTERFAGIVEDCVRWGLI